MYCLVGFQLKPLIISEYVPLIILKVLRVGGMRDGVEEQWNKLKFVEACCSLSLSYSLGHHAKLGFLFALHK